VKYALLVAAREFGEHVKTKGFWIGILLFPVLAIASVKVPQLLDRTKSTRHFAVVDPSGEFTAVVDAAIQAHYDRRNGERLLAWTEKKKANPEVADYEPLKPIFRRVDVPEEARAGDPKDVVRALKPWLVGDRELEVDGGREELFALIVLPESEMLLRSHVEYWGTNLADDELRDVVEKGLADELKRREFVALGVERADVEKVNKIDVDLEERDPKKAEGEEEVDQYEALRQWAPVGFVYMMFVAIMTVAQMLISSTIEEKSNRIVEVLLSSVTPSELMAGKLLGVAMVGVTMLVAWIGSLYGVMRLQTSSELAGVVVDILTTPKLIAPFLVYFVLGYLLYASVLLGLGSMCNTLKDAQNFMGPVMVVLIVPILSMVFIAKEPNGVLAMVLSWIPVFTPFVMMNRAAADPPLFDYVGTGIVLVLAIAFTIWLAGRIFRNGILRTGQPPKLLEILQLARG
jgi:ABC-2 type transport system permease protein